QSPPERGADPTTASLEVSRNPLVGRAEAPDLRALQQRRHDLLDDRAELTNPNGRIDAGATGVVDRVAIARGDGPVLEREIDRHDLGHLARLPKAGQDR